VRAFVLTNCHRLVAAGMWMSFAATVACADEARDAALARRDQAEQLEKWRRERDRTAAIQDTATAAAWKEPVPGESPCFVIHQVIIGAANSASTRQRGQDVALLGPVQQLGRFEGACMGAGSVEALRSNLQARLEAQGYVTSQLSVPPQALGQGVLMFEVSAGYVDAVLLDSAASTTTPARNALSLQAGDLLSLRDIEHSLENLARLPSQSSRFLIEPGAELGTSVVRIVPAGAPRWRGSVGIDSADSKDYGPWLASAQGTVDAPLGLSDQLSLSVSVASKHDPGERPQQLTGFAHWSVPMGRHLASLSVSSARHRRFFAGGVGRFGETGRDEQLRLRWQWTPWRGSAGRVQLWQAASERRARTFIDDIELLARRRIGSSLEAGASWWTRHPCGELTLDGEGARVMHLQRDTEFQAPLSGYPRQWQLNLQWNCQVATTGWALSGNASLQRASQTVDGTDLIVIGSRQTVRGHTLANALSGQGATVLRNELSGPAWRPGEEIAVRPWIGIDWGRIQKPISEARMPSELAGLALGARWQAAGFGGEITAAWPLASGAPKGAPRWSGGVRAAF
jgi:hemolysin activation/secretion protein